MPRHSSKIGKKIVAMKTKMIGKVKRVDVRKYAKVKKVKAAGMRER